MKVPVRIAYLDSVRGLAALSVVFSHYFLAYGFPESISFWVTNSPLHIFWDGFAAVSLFFVLSGYVLSKKYFSAPLPHYFLFASARFVRIWVPFAATLMVSFVLRETLPPEERFFTIESSWLREFWRGSSPLLSQAFLFVNNGQYRLIPQDWTLTQELGLSLLLPVFILLARRASWGFGILALASVYWLKLPILTFHFSLGILLARHEARILPFFRHRAGRAFLLLTALFFYTFRFSLPLLFPGLLPEQRIWYVTGMGSLLLLLYVLADGRAQRFFSRPGLVYLGSLSYAVYLLHFAVLTAFLPRFLFFLGLQGVVNVEWLRLAGLLFCLALTWLFAHFFHWYVDRLAIRWARYILKQTIVFSQVESRPSSI